MALPDVLILLKKVKIKGREAGKQHWVRKSSMKGHATQGIYSTATLSNPKARLKDMDRMGIDMQVIGMNLPNTKLLGRW